MPMKCCIAHCKSNYDTAGERTTIFGFPKPKAEWEMWCEALPTPIKRISKFMGVCAKHWPSDVRMVKIKRFLRPADPPSLFPSNPTRSQHLTVPCRKQPRRKTKNAQKQCETQFKRPYCRSNKLAKQSSALSQPSQELLSRVACAEGVNATDECTDHYFNGNDVDLAVTNDAGYSEASTSLLSRWYLTPEDLEYENDAELQLERSAIDSVRNASFVAPVDHKRRLNKIISTAGLFSNSGVKVKADLIKVEAVDNSVMTDHLCLEPDTLALLHSANTIQVSACQLSSWPHNAVVEYAVMLGCLTGFDIGVVDWPPESMPLTGWDARCTQLQIEAAEAVAGNPQLVEAAGARAAQLPREMAFAVLEASDQTGSVRIRALGQVVLDLCGAATTAELRRFTPDDISAMRHRLLLVQLQLLVSLQSSALAAATTDADVTQRQQPFLQLLAYRYYDTQELSQSNP